MPRLPLGEFYRHACRKAAGPCAFFGATVGAAVVWSDMESQNRKRMKRLRMWQELWPLWSNEARMCAGVLLGGAVGAAAPYVGTLAAPPVLCGYGLWKLCVACELVAIRKPEGV